MTGVQTCALPICPKRSSTSKARSAKARRVNAVPWRRPRLLDRCEYRLHDPCRPRNQRSCGPTSKGDANPRRPTGDTAMPDNSAQTPFVLTSPPAGTGCVSLRPEGKELSCGRGRSRLRRWARARRAVAAPMIVWECDGAYSAASNEMETIRT